MTKYNFNYEELGFDSEAEMKESIARVERRKNMDSVEVEIERMSASNKAIDTEGNIDIEAIQAGARLEYLDRLVQSKMYEAQQEATRQAEQAKVQRFMDGLAEHVDKDKKEKAQRELQKAKEKADAELQKEIFEKHGVKTDKQQAEDNSYRSMLKDLK